MAQSDSDEFEFVDSLAVAKEIAFLRKPDVNKIRTWLNPTNYTASSSEYHRHLSSQAPGTGEWIRETSQFKQWHSSDSHGSIWIKAVPGAGKSVVAASMVDSLARKEGVPVLYFFFRQIIETNRQSRSLLRDWLCQLLHASEIIQISLWDLIEDKKALETVSTDQLWKMLLSGLRSVEKAYILVDALDEMDLDNDFLGRLNDLGSFRPAHVKVMMTSRPKQYLQRAMRDPQVIHVSLEEELVKRDISVFVSQRVSQLGGLSSNSQELVHDIVCTRSQGLFLYARLMLDQVAKLSESGILYDGGLVLDMIVKLPFGLEEMYNSMLFEHAESSRVHQDIQVLILQLVTQSARPLRLIEIAKAIEASHLNLNRNSKEIVRTACGPLLEIMEDEVVQILHHSFTEFLLDTDRHRKDSPQFPVIDPMTAHRNIAITCLARLQGDVFKDCQEDPDPHLALQSIFLQYPLVEYALSKWPYHAKHYNAPDTTFFHQLEHFCDPKKYCFRAWLRLMSGGDVPVIAPRRAAPLHIAAAFGLKPWAEFLVKSGADVNELDGTQNTPLFWAASHNHAGIVRVLLGAGAKPDVDGYDGLKPLHAAASRNYWEVAKLLLQAGVSPITPKTRDIGRHCGNAPRSVGHSPLRYASRAGHTETVTEMMPYITKSGDLEDALSWAAESGHSRLLEAILNNSDVSVDGRLTVRRESTSITTGGETALILAAKSLDVACVRILLDKGADARKSTTKAPEDASFSRGRRGKLRGGFTALHSLVNANVDRDNERSFEQILDLLVTAGANLEAKDYNGDTPLLSALTGWGFSRKELSVVEMLLSRGADPFATDSIGSTLLHKACQSSPDTSIARKLLELHVTHSRPRSNDGATAMHCAVDNIHCPREIIKLLASFGADVDVPDANGDSPLMRACKANGSKYREVIDTLLELGANVNVQNSLGQTCLHLFQLRTQPHDQNETQLRSIIDAGADLELCDREGRTVLSQSIEKGNKDTVGALLKLANPSLTARTFRHGKSVLHLACHASNSLKIIDTLLSHGANAMWTDNDGNTLLHEVATRFRGTSTDIALVEKLVGLNIPVDARNSRRRTPLHIMSPISIGSSRTDDLSSRQTIVSVIQRLQPGLDLNAQDVDGFTALHLATAVSEHQTYNLLSAGARIDIKAFDGRTPLHCAARARQSNTVAMLLDYLQEPDSTGRHMLINAADNDGRTPLHDACRSGRPESVKLLLDAGADANQADNKHHTALMICAEFEEEDRLWRCLVNGQAPSDELRAYAFQDVSNYHGPPQDLLQHATARVSPIASLLLEAGAGYEHSMYGSPLSQAVKVNCVGLLTALQPLLPDGCSGYEATRLLFTGEKAREILESHKGEGPAERPAHFVASIDDITMGQLVSKGVDFGNVEGQCHERTTALNVIASLGLTEKMQKVIEKVNILDNPPFPDVGDKLRPVLLSACDRPVWNMDMLRLLVEFGKVDVNAHQRVKERENYSETGKVIPGPTALHVLAQGKYWWQAGAIKFLVDSGAAVDPLDENGRTPLDVASSRSLYRSGMDEGFFKPQCCDMLLELGANPDRTDKHGLVPLNHAGRNEDIIQVLLKHGANVNFGSKGPLMSAIEAGDVEIMKIYLEHGADCNIPDMSSGHKALPNKYPLVTAALPPSYRGWDQTTSKKMIELLLNHGAKLDLPISDKDTLIHYIFTCATTSVLRSFIDRPDIAFNIRDQEGRTVFLAACESTVDYENASGMGWTSTEELARLMAEYTPAYRALADSPLHGASIDYLAVDNRGHHVLHYLLPKWTDAIAGRFLPIPGVRDLILRRDNAGYTLLHHALKALKVTACLRFIEEGGADLLEPDPEGDTALHLLHRCRHVSWLPKCHPLMNRYIELGGDINSRNKRGEPPLFAFLTSCNLASRHSSGTQDEDHDPFLFFITNNADFKAVSNDNGTALHVVARRGVADAGWTEERGKEKDYNAKLFSRLVELGCDPLQEDEAGRTALDVAASIGNEAILKLYQRKKV